MNTKLITLSLELFNAVPEGNVSKISPKDGLKYGVVIDEKAAYATPAILDYFKTNQLTGEQLNATFHKSWKVIRDSSREELLLHQILHYMTTYGTNFKSDFIYIPTEKLKLPKVKQLPLKVIRGVGEQELVDKVLSMLKSGVALEETTIDKLLQLLQLIGYRFTSLEGIKNKEALIKIIAKTGVYPSSPIEFLRYLVYLATDATLLIKSKAVIESIKEKELNITTHLNQYGLEKCATIFNRFKPLWLAFKANMDNAPLINRMAKLSKTHHVPMPVDVLNTITSIKYKKREVKAALEGVNNFRKIRVLHALNTRINAADYFIYRIRNGKSFAKPNKASLKIDYYQKMYKVVYKDLLASLDLTGKKVKYPDNIDYALPTSEKMFIGNIPVGTKITTKKLVAGVYWENEWGARDLDLSALNLSGKIGWNSSYQDEGMLYSGDMTDATRGATELLYANKKIATPALAKLNIYDSGVKECKFKMIIGCADKVSQNYMFNPNELIMEIETEMKSKQQILGLFSPEADNKMSFTLVNTGFGNIPVSGNSEHSDNARAALYFQYAQPISFRKLLEDAGVIFTEEEFDIDLSVGTLQKDSLLNLIANSN